MDFLDDGDLSFVQQISLSDALQHPGHELTVWLKVVQPEQHLCPVMHFGMNPVGPVIWQIGVNLASPAVEKPNCLVRQLPAEVTVIATPDCDIPIRELVQETTTQCFASLRRDAAWIVVDCQPIRPLFLRADFFCAYQCNVQVFHFFLLRLFSLLR